MTVKIAACQPQIKQFTKLALFCVGLLGSLLVTASAWPAVAVYQVIFTATWSAETHPEDFPGNPHFSGLIGGTHNAAVSFWNEGELASLGIQRMAEWGSQTPLDEEVEAAIAAGHAESVLRGGIIYTSPGMTSMTFILSEEFSLVTLVSMIAPSPDWFVGVSGVDLHASDEWAEELIIQLWPYDAGTDSGTSYNSPDQPTDPHEPISLITNGPLGNGIPLGTFTFTLLGQPSDVPMYTAIKLDNIPNPFNPTTNIRFTLPRDDYIRLEVYDLTGRRIDTLLNEEYLAGQHLVTFTPENLASGTYLYLLHTSDGTLARKMTLLK